MYALRSLSAKIGQDSPRPQRVATLSPIQPMITLTTDKAARSSCGVVGNCRVWCSRRWRQSRQQNEFRLFGPGVTPKAFSLLFGFGPGQQTVEMSGTRLTSARYLVGAEQEEGCGSPWPPASIRICALAVQFE